MDTFVLHGPHMMLLIYYVAITFKTHNEYLLLLFRVVGYNVCCCKVFKILLNVLLLSFDPLFLQRSLHGPGAVALSSDMQSRR